MMQSKRPTSIRYTGSNCYDVLRFIGREDLLLAGLNELKQTDAPVIPIDGVDVTANPGDLVVRTCGTFDILRAEPAP